MAVLYLYRYNIATKTNRRLAHFKIRLLFCLAPDPSQTGCPKDAWSATFSLTYPAIVREKIEWFNSSFSSNYAGDVAGRVSDGRHIFSSGVFPRYWTGNVFEYDFGRPVFCGGCSTNQIGGALGDICLCINKDCPITPGTAETDVTMTITYPQ